MTLRVKFASMASVWIRPARLWRRAAQPQDRKRMQKYASRGGIKLEGALSELFRRPGRLGVPRCRKLDGGVFTDCLLQHGASRVYAVDVNVDQLAWKLRQDPRVVASNATAASFGRKIYPNPSTSR